MDTEKGVSRRAFIGGMASLTASAVFASGCAPAEQSRSSAVEADAHSSDEEMTREEALAALEDEAEFTQDLILDDGTVIPALFVRVRNRINRVGIGLGSGVDTSANHWAFVTRAFSEEEAEYYLEMPLTKNFTAVEMSVLTERDEAKCLEICEALASRGILYRTRRGGEARFRLIPQINGIWEYSINVWADNDTFDVDYLDAHWMQYSSDHSTMDSDTPPANFRSLPVSADIIGDERIMSPFDDFESIIRRHTVIALGDCVCRADATAHGNPCNHPKSTEILTGEEAEYYIENGIGWPITQEEALKVLHDAVDEGLIIQTVFTKASEIFCCCCGDSCKMLNGIKAEGGGEAMIYYSHYTLSHNKDSCIKCGQCASRCHMEAISYDEDGYPTTSGTCVRCGQCAVVCPAEARQLFVIEDYPELPDTLVDNDLEKAITRMKRNHITDYIPRS